jgi:hypothetical protein
VNFIENCQKVVFILKIVFACFGRIPLTKNLRKHCFRHSLWYGIAKPLSACFEERSTYDRIPNEEENFRLNQMYVPYDGIVLGDGHNKSSAIMANIFDLTSVKFSHLRIFHLCTTAP